jgi:hypothetical protein
MQDFNARLITDLSHLKALGRPEGSLPTDVSIKPAHESSGINVLISVAPLIQVVFEALVALVLGIIGASLNAPALKDITWQAEMRERYVVR